MGANEGRNEGQPRGPEGTVLLDGPCGIQIRTTKGHRWSDEAETIFLDQLAATCNVKLAGDACGFSHAALYRRRRRDPAFMQRWDAALAQGYAHLESLIVRRAIDALEGFAPDPDAAVRIPEVSMRDALAVLGSHRRTIEGGPRSRRQWARPRSLDEVRDSILRKLEAVAPSPVPLAGGDGGGDGRGPAEVSVAPEAPDPRPIPPAGAGLGVGASAGQPDDTGPPPAPPACGRGECACPAGGRGDSEYPDGGGEADDA